MKENKIKILILMMTVAVLGLVVLQIYWSVKTIETEEVRFNATINKVLSDVVLKIEKNRTADVLIEKIGGDSTKVIWVSENENQKDSNKIVFFSSGLTKEQEIVLDKHDIDIRVEVKSDFIKERKNDKKNKKILKRVITVNSNLNGKEKVSTKVDTLRFDREHLVTEVLEDMVSFKKENYFNYNLTEKYIDSLIRKTMVGNGIDTEYLFGVINKENNEFVIIKSGANKNNLLKSKFVKSLSPYDLFSNSLMLRLYIPNVFEQVLKSIWLMFLLSLLFISIIIGVYIKTVKMFLKQKKVTEVKNDLINNITHEFKTPISAISLASEALAEPKLMIRKNSVERYSAIIREENKKLTKLVETLLNTAAFEKSKIELKLETVELENVVSGVVESISSRNQNVNIVLHILSDSPIKSKIDIFHFTNILNNLIDNSIKYSKDNPEIIMSVKQLNSGVEISVTDKGIGISKNNQEKIFDTFYRVETGNIHTVKGNGIGLSYVKKIVEAHNGNVSVKSKINEGSTFVIFIPNVE